MRRGPWPGRRVAASALDLTAPPERPGPPAEGAERADLWTLLLTEQGPAAEAAGAAALAAAEHGVYTALEPGAVRRRFAVVRGGLRLLAAARLGCPPGRIAVLDGACPLCARPHDSVAAVAGAEPVHFSWDRCGDLIVYALSGTTVGAGASPLADHGDPDAAAAARRTARLTAGGRAVMRGGCTGPGIIADRSVDMVAVPHGYAAAVVRHTGTAGQPA
ncbi:hypothetical protein [Streptomyces sp. NBC_00385]|uniref:hypothetical protein n=1 Tax=Streptomyces sp. NBC_00385 TaxID=2975733 RepID=UPI002DDC5184|nr:hypothetical protein [Streptomyces sp. NBC_00385]WRZ04874.1 hypothetical protein OG959_16665 [Streptomyces sp. NBC_00385]